MGLKLSKKSYDELWESLAPYSLIQLTGKCGGEDGCVPEDMLGEVIMKLPTSGKNELLNASYDKNHNRYYKTVYAMSLRTGELWTSVFELRTGKVDWRVVEVGEKLTVQKGD